MRRVVRFFDPLYWVVIGVSALVSFATQAWVHNHVSKWRQVALSSGMTGADIARAILEARRISDVRVERTEGVLTDHYDPTDKALRLSPEVYDDSTVTAAGIAAHEVGHALQDQYVVSVHGTCHLPRSRVESSVPCERAWHVSFTSLSSGIFSTL